MLNYWQALGGKTAQYPHDFGRMPSPLAGYMPVSKPLAVPTPTMRDRVQGAVRTGLNKVGVGHQFADKVSNFLNDFTPVGAVTGAYDAGQQFGQATQGPATLGKIGLGAAALGSLGLSMLPYGADARAGAKALGAARRGGMFGNLLADESGAIRAWHGSPYDFDKFDMSKIGTGEGAQAYGHGLYFAENPDVAKEYRDTLSKGRGLTGSVLVNGVRPSALPAAEQDALSTLKYYGFDQDKAIAALQGQIARFEGDPKAANIVTNARAALAAVPNVGRPIERPPGHLYEVNINAEPEQFLNWDAPNSADPRLSALGLQPKPWRGNPNGPPPDLYYRGLTDSPTTFDKLVKGGIPGIRYLDQGSRGAGGGTSNYVVFDPALIDILAKH